MEYIAALTPSVVMAVAFTALIVTIVKSQGGANKSKEDAAVDRALAQAEAARAASPADGAPRS
ncbi:hypothetical protein ACLIYM_27940 [Streptomyces fenghuangensis]|uniref:Small hydrophobic protein n=1 Tax=Streptomyces chitinivorans TaxID=1257027 RepID=A0ABW7HZL6_9ACTN|nr:MULTISPECIES: hypothetical protein [Streptomyces]MCG3042079.1 hypothetical protein [Streptomyces sp. ICN903]MDH2410602.1 hypothetical protein [Streptomyces chitinivorans]